MARHTSPPGSRNRPAVLPCGPHLSPEVFLMRILILSDIHANLTALETVLEEAGETDAVWCLGDLVGYGPDPNECVARVRALPHLICLVGNHDKAALAEIDVADFNPEAQVAVNWTRQALNESTQRYLRSLPERVAFENYTLVHGSPRKPGGGD